MQGHLMFSFIGELRSIAQDRESLVIHRVVACDARLDNQDIAIHTQWILFDEPVTCSIGVWPGRSEKAAPIFEVTQTLEPESTPGTLARICTVSVRLRREVLEPASVYWVKVFRGGELVTQYPLKLSAEGVQEARAVH
ncbi:MAG TPA: hypothetical protein VFM39_01030 [bacterium]|nr:hypothetical protein [bacterium]